MGELRIRAAVDDILQTAFDTDDIHDSIHLLAGLCGSNYQEERIPLRYDVSTGSVVKWTWRPLDAWDGRLWYGCSFNHPNLSRTRLLINLSSLIPEGVMKGFRIAGDDDILVIQHYPRRYDDGGTVPPYFQVTKLGIVKP